MLSPTHEEEITSLVAGTLNSYKDLPLRLYQISQYPDPLGQLVADHAQHANIAMRSGLAMASFAPASFS